MKYSGRIEMKETRKDTMCPLQEGEVKCGGWCEWFYELSNGKMGCAVRRFFMDPFIKKEKE